MWQRRGLAKETGSMTRATKLAASAKRDSFAGFRFQWSHSCLCEYPSLSLCVSSPLSVCAVNLWLEAKTTTIHLMSFYGRTHTRHYLIRFQLFERSTCCAGPQQLQLKYLSLPLSVSLSRAYHLTFVACQFSVNFSLTASLSISVCLSQTVSSCFSPVSICKNNFCLAFIPHSRIKVNS